MREYFHFVPHRIQTRTRKMLIFTAVLCAEMCVAAFFVLIFNILTAFNLDVIIRMLITISGIILAGMVICFGMAAISHRKVRRGSRYTYLDIQQKAMIFSLYGGEYRVQGEKVITRDIYYIPFSELKSIEPEKNGKGVILTGKIRHYSMNSEFMGYHVTDGDIVFDRQWLNIGGFEKIDSVRIPHVFGKSERVIQSVKEAYKRFVETPKPKPYVFREADFIRRRAKPRVLPEDFGYSRRW